MSCSSHLLYVQSLSLSAPPANKVTATEGSDQVLDSSMHLKIHNLISQWAWVVGCTLSAFLCVPPTFIYADHFNSK
jgi:hypothetical protein